MALLLTEPFNDFTSAPWTVSAFTIVAGGRTGNGAQSGGTSTCSYSIAAGSQTDTVTTGFAFKVSTLASQRWLLGLIGPGNINMISLTVETTGALVVHRGNNVAAVIGTTAVGLVVANTWYYLELSVKVDDTAGTVVLRLNGTTVLNLSGVDTQVSGTPGTVPDTYRLQGTSGGTHLFDDLYLRNDNVFQGDPTLGPTGNGAIVFAGAGVAKVGVKGIGSGAIAFNGAGSAVVTFLGGTGAIVFDGRGTAKISPLRVVGVGHIDFGARGDIDVEPPLDVYAPPEYSWLVLRPDGTPIGPLTAATGRKLTLQLDGAATATFTMPGEHPQTATITELATDLYVARNGRPLFRGRIGGSSETHAAAADTVTLTATDYRGLLTHRLLWPSSQLEFADVDQSDIAWQLITDTQALGNLRITRGVGGVTGVARDRKFTAGIAVAQAIQGLAAVADGFDWEVDAHLAFNVYHPERGRYPAGVAGSAPILTYGRDVLAVTTTVDPSRYANAVYFTGSDDTEPAAPTVAISPDVGRWELQKADPNATLQTTVEEEAVAVLEDASRLPSAIVVTLAADIWNPYRLWLGDRVRAVIVAGRLDLDVTRRIVQIDVTIDDTGVETVALAIGAAPPKLTDRLNNLQKQVTQLQLEKNGGGGGGGGGDGGGIKEITSTGGTIVVSNPTGPTTNLEVASGVGHIIVTNPTGPTVNVEYAAPDSDSVSATYHISLLSDLVSFHEYGFYSFGGVAVPWLQTVPPDEAGFVCEAPTGFPIVRITQPGTYTLTAHVATLSHAEGTDIDGNVVMVPIHLNVIALNPFGMYHPGDDFYVGFDAPATITGPAVRITSFDLANNPHAAFHVLADIQNFPAAWMLRGGDVTLSLTLTRVP